MEEKLDLSKVSKEELIGKVVEFSAYYSASPSSKDHLKDYVTALLTKYIESKMIVIVLDYCSGKIEIYNNVPDGKEEEILAKYEESNISYMVTRTLDLSITDGR